MPASVHRARMEAALRRAKTRDVTIKVFDNANHAFLEAVTGGRREGPALRGFVAGYLGTHVEWLTARIAMSGASAVGDSTAPEPSSGPANDGQAVPPLPAFSTGTGLPSPSRFFPPSAFWASLPRGVADSLNSHRPPTRGSHYCCTFLRRRR